MQYSITFAILRNIAHKLRVARVRLELCLTVKLCAGKQAYIWYTVLYSIYAASFIAFTPAVFLGVFISSKVCLARLIL